MVYPLWKLRRMPLAPSPFMLPIPEPKQRYTSHLLLSVLLGKVENTVHREMTFAHPLIITHPISFALK